MSTFYANCSSSVDPTSASVDESRGDRLDDAVEVPGADLRWCFVAV
jgi:hypothetical protein